MDFFTNNEISDEKTCKDIIYRYELYDKVILYEEDSKGSKHQNVELSDEDIKKNGGIDRLTLKGVFATIKEFFMNLFNYFKKVPKRVFINTHQFFGCSHLMAVRYFIYSINDCTYQSEYCESSKRTCSATKDENFPRMGYFADKSDIRYKTSFSSFYVNTSPDVPFCYDYRIKRNNNDLNSN